MPISPRLLKGAIISLDPNLGIPLGTITFQYKPDEVTRSLKPQSVGEEPTGARCSVSKGRSRRSSGGNRDRLHFQRQEVMPWTGRGASI